MREGENKKREGEILKRLHVFAMLMKHLPCPFH